MENSEEKKEVVINRTHEKGILKAIKENPVYCFNDIFVFYKGCSRATAYNHNLDKLDSIKEAIYMNKRGGKTTLLDKWIKGDNATTQIAAMRMICDPDEHRRLNQNYNDITSGGEKINVINLGEGEAPEK